MGEEIAAGSTAFYVYLGLVAALVLFAGLMSGLTIGLLSMDPLHLQVVVAAGQEPLASRARRVQSVVKHHHLLLVTLLLANAGAMEALPLFLDRLVSPVAALLLSVTLVLLFGEVVPQSLCSRYGLAIGAFFVPVVKALMFVLFPVAWPIAKLLDVAVGHSNGTFFRRSELKELLALHAAPLAQQPRHLAAARHPSGAASAPAESLEDEQRQGLLGAGGSDSAGSYAALEEAVVTADGVAELPAPVGVSSGGHLALDEVAMLRGALEMKETRVDAEMTPLEQCYMLPADERITPAMLRALVASGFSRVPVYDGSRHRVRGVLLTKSLVGLDVAAAVEESLEVGQLGLVRPLTISGSTSLYDALNIFQRLKCHLAIILEEGNPLNVVGLLTLEDVVESLISEEIFDETDVYQTPARTLRVARAFLHAATPSAAAARRRRPPALQGHQPRDPPSPLRGPPAHVRCNSAHDFREDDEAPLGRPALSRISTSGAESGWRPSRERHGAVGVSSPIVHRRGMAVWAAAPLAGGGGEKNDNNDDDDDASSSGPPVRSTSDQTLM